MRSLVLAAALACLALTGCELFDAETTATVQVKQSDCSDCTLDVGTDGTFAADVASEAICADAEQCTDAKECDVATECDGPSDCAEKSDCSMEWEECDKPAAPTKDGGPN